MYKRVLPWLPAVIALCLIFYLTLQSPQETTELSGTFHRWLLSLFPKGKAPDWLKDEHLIRSMAHIPEYFILGCCFYFGFRSLPYSKTKVCLSTIAVSGGIGLADEVLKACLPTRHFEARDFGLDLVGAVLAVIFMMAVITTLQNRKTNVIP